MRSVCILHTEEKGVGGWDVRGKICTCMVRRVDVC